MANKIQIRRDTTTNWTAVNPILSEGELGLDTTLDKIKIGNGTSTWSALSFFVGDIGPQGIPGVVGEQGIPGVAALNEVATPSFLGGVKLGEGFTTNSIDQVTTSKLYNTNATNPNQHYRLELDTNGVLHLADGSIINGSTLKGVAGTGELNFTGITIGPDNSHSEETWMWVDSTGATIATEFSTAAHQWKFDNNGDLNLPVNGGIVFDRAHTSIRVGMGFHITSGEGISLEAINETDPNNLITAGWYFASDGILTVPGNIATDGNHLTGWSGNLDLNIDGSIKLSADANCALTLQANSHQWSFGTDGNLTLPQGSIVSETSNTIAFAPPTAAAGQSLVIRPTTVGWTVTASGYIVYGASQAVFVTTSDSQYFGTVNYTFSGCTAEQLGRALTGQITFPGGGTGNPQSIQWTIPANSNITTFTFTLGSAVGVAGVDHNFEYNGLPDGHFVTVTNNGITNSEFSHVHLVAGNPTTVDMYLGDDDQYVKIEKNAGNVVVGTNLNTHQWTFGTNSNLTLPNASTISPVSQVGYSYGPYASDIYNNTTGGALSGGTETVVNIGNTVHNNLFDPPVPNATTTTGTIATNGDFVPGTSTGTFDLHTKIIVGGQLLGDLNFRDNDNPGAGFTLAQSGVPYTGSVVTSGTLIQGYNGWITRTPKTTTYIRWADGSSSQVTGSSVNQYPNHTYSGLITTDNVSGKSFPATLYTANYIPSGTAIGVNGNDWKFGTDGKLKLPGSTFIDTSPNYIHASHGIGLHPSHNTGGTGPELYIYYDDGIVVQPFTNDYLTPNNAAAPLVIRGSNLPSGSASTGKTAGNVYIEGGRNAQDNTYGKVIVNSGITSQWQFNSSGQLTFPDTTIQTTAYQKVAVPAHSYGVTGDKVGMVAFDADYMYYCTANYVDNTTDIWKRTAHGTGTW